MALTSRISSWKLLLVTNFSYSVTKFSMKFTANAKNTAQIELAVGINTNTNLAQNFIFDRGMPASIQIIDVDDATGALTGGVGMELFHGYVVDFAPSSLQYGAFSYTVTLQGILSYLATGTLQNSGIVPSTYLDSAAQLWVTSTDLAGTAAGVPTGQIDPAVAYQQGFLTGLKNALIPIAEATDATPDSLTQQIRTLFNTSTNQTAAAILKGIGGDGSNGTIVFGGGYPTSGSGGSGLTFRTQTGAEDLCNGTCSRISDLMRNDWQYASFYDRLLAIGGGLMFSVIETGEKIRCVPHIPFFHRSSVRNQIPASEYSNISVVNQPPIPNIAGAVLTHTSGTYSTATGSALIRATYRRPYVPSTTYSPGQVIVASMPPMLAMSPWNGATGHEATVTSSHDLSGNIPDETSEEMAKLIAWTAAYKPFRVVVTCPFLRTDIAPLTAVRVDFPISSEVGAALDTGAIYGVVQSVTLQGDASQQFAQTQIEIAYVRSYTQQVSEIDNAYNGHPIWSNNWYGCDLYGNHAESGF